MQSNVGLHLMLVELALSQKSGNGGIVLIHSVQASVTWQTQKRCWIIAKPEKEAPAREVLKDTVINMTVEGQKHVGAVKGSQDYLQDYVN